MRISQQTIDHIMATAKVEEVVGDVVQLKKRGTNLLGLCPFHNEKTPSFTVSPSKEIYKCFGCGKAGNVVGFVMDHEGMAYPEALRFLARRYNIHIEEEEGGTPKDEAQASENEALLIVLQAAGEYFRDALHNSEEGKAIGLAYCRHRGIDVQLVEDFGLGWAPADRFAFGLWAVQKGYSPELLVKAGLCVDSGGHLSCRYVERLVFPIHNASGKIVGFAGRTLKTGTKDAKYINSPETPVYQKSKLLYGLHRARRHIRSDNFAILVEGYTDVMGLHGHGLPQAVASSGTSLTDEQAQALGRLTDSIYIFYDGDNAGRAASLRAIDVLLGHNVMPRVLALPPEHDPDSYLKENSGLTGKEIINKLSQTAVAFRYNELLAQGDDIHGRSHALAEALKLVLKVPDLVQRDLYLKDLAQRSGTKEDVLYAELRRLHVRDMNSKRGNQPPPLDVPPAEPQEETAKAPADGPLRQEKEALKMLLLYAARPYAEQQTVGQALVAELQDAEWHYPQCAEVLDALKQTLEAEPQLEGTKLLNRLPQPVQAFFFPLLMEAHSLSPAWQEQLGRTVVAPGEDYLKETDSAMRYFRLRKIDAILTAIDTDLGAESDFEKQAGLLEEKMALLELRKALGAQMGLVVG